MVAVLKFQLCMPFYSDIKTYYRKHKLGFATENGKRGHLYNLHECRLTGTHFHYTFQHTHGRNLTIAYVYIIH